MPYTYFDWVPVVNNPHILFITENYPNDPNALNSTYFYRCFNPNNHQPIGSNNLLNNLCNVTQIPNYRGLNEHDRLAAFMARGYFLIDTFEHGLPMRENPLPINNINIVEDITVLNPLQIIFTCVGSNGPRFNEIYNALPENLQNRVVIRSEIQPVFYSPSNWGFNGFQTQINHHLENQTLFLNNNNH